jgi:multidrug efflux pump subunit AcrA (membrane-fusion protein)
MRAKFDNHDFLLHPGQYVKVRIQSSFPKKGLVIPQVAVQSALGGKFVMVVNKDNIIEIKDIALGYKFLDKVVIKKGLNVGDRVVTQGIQKVRRGMTVTPIFDSPLIEDPGEMETVSKEKAASDLKSSSQTFGDKKTH